MTATTRSKARRLSAQSAELALAVPQVMAHRLARMAAAGHQPDARDRREFQRMGAEKVAAFTASWMAMGAEMWRIQQQGALLMMRAWSNPWLVRWPSPGGESRRMQNAALGIVSKGLAPVHRAATGNARRLGRAKPRQAK